jgi:hypothetical protein
MRALALASMWVRFARRPRTGSRTVLTILDTRVQRAAQSALGDALERQGGQSNIEVRMEAFDREGGSGRRAHGWHSCPSGQECRISCSKFEAGQAALRSDEHQGRQYISSTYRTWSGDRTRWARITAIYRLPPD